MAVNHQFWDYVVSTQQEKDKSVRKEEVYNVDYIYNSSTNPTTKNWRGSCWCVIRISKYILNFEFMVTYFWCLLDL